MSDSPVEGSRPVNDSITEIVPFPKALLHRTGRHSGDRHLAGGVGIEIQGTAWMQAQRAGRAHRIDRTQEGAADGLFLECARYCAEDCVPGEKSRYGDGQCAHWNIGERSKTSVIYLLLAA